MDKLEKILEELEYDHIKDQHLNDEYLKEKPLKEKPLKGKGKGHNRKSTDDIIEIIQKLLVKDSTSPKEPTKEPQEYSRNTLDNCEKELKKYSYNHYIDLQIDEKEIKMRDFLDSKKDISTHKISQSQLFIEYFKKYIKINDTITSGDSQYLFIKGTEDNDFRLVKQLNEYIYPLCCATIINKKMEQLSSLDDCIDGLRYFCKGFEFRTRFDKSFYVPIFASDVRKLIDSNKSGSNSNKRYKITKDKNIDDNTTIVEEKEDWERRILKSNEKFRNISKKYETTKSPEKPIFFAIDIKKTLKTDVVHIIILQNTFSDVLVGKTIPDGLFLNFDNPKTWGEYKTYFEVNESLTF